MLISVVVPTCHRNDLLARCLEGLAPGAQTLPADQYEVIVTDDGTRSTAEALIGNRGKLENIIRSVSAPLAAEHHEQERAQGRHGGAALIEVFGRLFDRARQGVELLERFGRFARFLFR